jgi:glycerol-3-phosphate dehydrogenase subunit C
MKATRPLALKVAKPAANAVKKAGDATLCSDCPLACKHLVQVIGDAGDTAPTPKHPIEVFAEALGAI